MAARDEIAEKVPAGSWRVFTAATRVPTWRGVPSVPLAVAGAVIVILAVKFSPWLYLAAIPAWMILSAMTATDDRGLRQWWLWARFTLLPALRHWGSYRLWGAVCHSACDYEGARRMPLAYAMPFVAPPLIFAILFYLPAAALAIPAWFLARWFYGRRTAK